MELSQIIQARRSIRKYKGDAIAPEQLEAVLEAGRLAPSWKNGQCWTYIVVSDPAVRLALGEAVGFNPDRTAYEAAPYVLVQCADPAASGDLGGKDYYMMDAGISLEHMVLQAAELGLGTCWVGWFDEQPVKDLLGIPEGQRVVALTPLGVPDQAPKARPRKAMADMVFYNGWGQKA